MILCEYGCGQEAKYQFKNGKWCCSKFISQCSTIRRKNSISSKGQPGFWKDKFLSFETKEKLKKSHMGQVPWNKNKSGIYSIFTRKLMGIKKKNKKPWNKNKLFITIEDIKVKHSLFYKIEKMRYNPNKQGEIQVHCKNHNCKNSKEKGGWFTPSRSQLYNRIYTLETTVGCGESNFYCCDLCKNECPLYNLYSDPYKNNNLPYTPGEYQTFRIYVLERDNYTCQFCGDSATLVHHERPQKLEPFFALDPDYAWSCCEKCHYEKGHQGECSTGNLAKIVCKER